MVSSLVYNMVQQRQVAYKVWISDLVNGKYIKEEGEWDPNYILVRDKIKVSRVNIIASLVNKYKSESSEYSYITIDDGSSDINVKAWREDTELLNRCEIGDLILLIGRVREFSDEIVLQADKSIADREHDAAAVLDPGGHDRYGPRGCQRSRSGQSR